MLNEAALADLTILVKEDSCDETGDDIRRGEGAIDAGTGVV